MTFHTTRWSLVLRAGTPDAAGAAALAELCGAYWQPVYALYRREGQSPDDARDLTQGLFADLIERGDLGRGDPARGPFRAFLRACARNWLLRQKELAQAGKRGGGRAPISLDCASEEQALALAAVDHLDANALFERRWAQTVIDRALARLERDETAARRGPLLIHLRSVLDGSPPPRPWAQLATELGTTEGALKVAAHRLKTRFRECLCEEVRDTLPEGLAEGDELRELLQALGTSTSPPIPRRQV